MSKRAPAECCGSISPAHRQIIRLMAEHDARCYYCNCECTMTCGLHQGRLAPNSATRDHLIPKSQGGQAEHLVLACFECNNRLGDIPYQSRKEFVYA